MRTSQLASQLTTDGRLDSTSSDTHRAQLARRDNRYTGSKRKRGIRDSNQDSEGCKATMLRSFVRARSCLAINNISRRPNVSVANFYIPLPGYRENSSRQPRRNEGRTYDPPGLRRRLLLLFFLPAGKVFARLRILINNQRQNNPPFAPRARTYGVTLN